MNQIQRQGMTTLYYLKLGWWAKCISNYVCSILNLLHIASFYLSSCITPWRKKYLEIKNQIEYWVLLLFVGKTFLEFWVQKEMSAYSTWNKLTIQHQPVENRGNLPKVGICCSIVVRTNKCIIPQKSFAADYWFMVSNIFWSW